jgi:8-oxo-dGTP pyrophosphatase MutT (NUDIX family)
VVPRVPRARVVNEPRLRQAARAIVLDPADRILLVEFTFPDSVVWATPGGGLAERETDADALRRELDEEAGLREFAIGPRVWNRTHLEPFGQGRWDGQTERFYLVRTPAFEPASRLSWEQLRDEGMTAVRWWEPDELEAAETLFAPRRLPALVRELVVNGPPAEPLDVGL